MLYELEQFADRCDTRFSVADLTVVIAVRAHDQNPWVLPRLTMLRQYYDPLPTVVVVDFGSAPLHAEQLRECCHKGGYTYHRVDDAGVFALSVARNRGFEQVHTTLLFFSDVDCFGSRNLFQRLVEQANILQLGLYFDQIIDLPVYHLSPNTTARILSSDDPHHQSLQLDRACARQVYAVEDDSFVDPHSNFFLLHRRFFDLVGGYDEHFRGHGSEDFEFLLRVALHTRQFPLPAEPLRDEYGPLSPATFGAKRYLGFRRLFEAMALQSEAAGLRIAHLHHPRPRTADSWYDHNDHDRSRFYAAANPLLSNPHQLLSKDWLKRDKRALVLMGQPDHYGFFLPLRLAGYRLDVHLAVDREQRPTIQARIEAGTYNAVALFNPFMASHSELRTLFETAKKHGAQPIVLERGALPESFYYADDVSYNDVEYSRETLDAAALDPSALELARVYQARLTRGDSTLERQGDFQATTARLTPHRRDFAHACLVPLQLDDDMAVTQFTSGHISYPDFLQDLAATIAVHPETLFFVKVHPLSKQPHAFSARNVVLCDSDDHIHALIELVDSVLLYNSGVGLLALIHGKPLATIGNAFYNLDGLGIRAQTPQEAARQLFTAAAPPDGVVVTRLVAWLLTSKYSFFKAESIIKDFGFRRSHAYKHLDFYAFNYRDVHVHHQRAGRSLPMPLNAYAASRLGTLANRENGSGMLLGGSLRTLIGPKRHDSLRRKLNKLRRNPQRFFSDSRSPYIRWFGRILLREQRGDK